MKNLLLVILLFVFIISKGIVISEHEKRYNTIASTNQTISEINNLIVSYKDSLLFANNNEDIKNSAFFNLVISKLYYKLGSYNNSISFGKVALQNYETVKDTFFIMSALTSMGAIYGEINEREIALDFFKRIEKLAIASNDSIVLAYNYLDMAASISKNDSKNALEYIEKSEKIERKKPINKTFKYFLLTNKASIYFNLGKYHQAKQIYLTLINMMDKNHYFYGSMCTNIAQTYSKLGVLDSALYYSKLALDVNPEMYSLNNLANTYFIMTNVYLRMDKSDSSKVYLEKYKNYNDSLIVEKKTEYTSKLKVIYETDKLIDDIEIKKQEIQESNSKIRTMAIALVLFSIALILFFIFYKKLQSSYKNIVRESVQAIKMEEKITNLENQLNQKNNLQKSRQINIENTNEIFDNILHLLENEKLFTDEDFDVNKLAEKLNTNRTYISKIINSRTNGSFVSFVNSYRIKEAKKMLIDDINSNLTLNAIGKMSGFKSSATFYRVFKQETGVTPSFFVKNKNTK